MNLNAQPPRSGIGDPPKGCTCLMATYTINRIGPHSGKTAWGVHISKDDCPVHSPGKD